MPSHSMTLNPHIQYYSTVYVVSMAAALLLKTLRGLVFVKVSFPETSLLLSHALSTQSLMNFETTVVFEKNMNR